MYVYIYIMYTYIYTYIKYRLLWRFRVNTYLTHAPPPIWRFRFIIYLEHRPSFGYTGSSYILNTTPPLAISVRDIKHGPTFATYICKTHHLIWIYSTYVLTTPPHFRDSGST